MKPTTLLQTTLSVRGMTCGSCEQRVNRALMALPGVMDAQANHATGETQITYTAAGITPTEMAEAVSAAGYPATGVTATLASEPGGSGARAAATGCGCGRRAG